MARRSVASVFANKLTLNLWGEVMGYEIKLIIGKSLPSMAEIKRQTEPVIDNNTVYFPYVKDEKGDFVHTGKQEIDFLTVAELDLCKIGDGALLKLIVKNQAKAKADKKNVHKCYQGDATLEKDCYGEPFLPEDLEKVIHAIEEDNVHEKYRRFDWALALLKSIHDTSPFQYNVIFYGF
jgi:hypothetical protein